MNYARKALDLARERKGVSSLILVRKFKLSFEEAEKLANDANTEYLRRVENTKRTRFQPAVRAPGKRVYRMLTKLPKNQQLAKTPT